MSMLTEQCARLRSWAKQFDERADFGALAPLLAGDLREAADTIISLRDKLQAAELGGTCELVETDSYSNPHEFVHVLECSACGETCEHVNGSYQRCPHCGRRTVER